MELVRANKQFIEDIIDGMYDWVRVLDTNFNVIFMNKAMSKGLNNPPLGDKCYKNVGKSEPCENCISKQAFINDCSFEKDEIINGRVFSVMSSPLKIANGDIIAIVEVMRDTTQLTEMRKKLMMQNKKLMDDLLTASKLQMSLLPKSFSDEYIDFNYIYKPCRTLGGDFLDIFKIDEDRMGFYIADVSGHGVVASMITIFLHSTIDKSVLSPAQVLSSLNEQFNKIYSLDEDMYITIFYAIIDLKKKTICYSNAGHSATPQLITESSVIPLKIPGIPVSNWPFQIQYSDETVEYEKNSLLLFFSDGIMEVRNAQKEQFGKKRLLQHILENKDKDPDEVLESAVEKACRFANIEDISGIPDDIAIALIRLK